MRDVLLRFYTRITNCKGQTMAEYAIVISAIVTVCVLAYNSLGSAVNAKLALITAIF